ncbi:hypothetical protein WOLCODRAFT_74423 [Wolfiporia cocos MD-104 SS10]|uniref:Uncharacterized protein n=1 Tax=Wolfiporia cocos (strain MD-104) TaxID=742152 RepID=A0A2H3JM20_WOLCO|nr:hypothetical protein WOLCODRAFT_74423 [Wolfiporia cocos MD-104 SS10]
MINIAIGTNLALTISQLLQAEGQKVDVLIMLDGAPTLFHRPYFREYTKRRLTEGTLRDDIIDVVGDMSTSGSLDGAHEITHQFADHFKESKTGGSGPKWVARFCKAYAAHVLMGVRASKEVLKREEDGTLKDLAWPTARTVLVSATNGVAVQPYAVGASKYFDLEAWAPHIELHELPGTHFGLLNPDSGLAEVINGVLQ